MKEEKEDQGFVFKDRRKISIDEPEEARATTVDREDLRVDDEATQRTEAGSEETPRPGESGRQRDMPLPEVNFSTFVFSLSSSALVHLGEIPEPSSQKPHQDLNLAKQIIDTLGMIEEKTRGNLEADEERLLKGVLYDLRMRFVQKSK
jgi:hypothetical protein